MSDTAFAGKLQAALPPKGAESYAFYDVRPRNPAEWTPVAVQGMGERFIAALNEHANAADDLPLDRQLAELNRLYLAAVPEDRHAVRHSISNDLRWSLLHFAHRCAVKALRVGSRDDLLLALSALSIEDVRSDFRDTISMLALVHHVCIRIDVDAALLFAEVGRVSSERGRQALTDFLKRAPGGREITLFAFHQGTSENGPTLVHSAFAK